MEINIPNFSEVSPLDISCTNGNGEDSSVLDTDCLNCVKARDEDPGVKSDIPVLLKLIYDVYSQRLLSVENNKNLNEKEKTEEKILVLKSYIEQLQKQCDTFGSTMVELEKEALQRVKQMEKRLNSSAKTTMEAVINIHECEKEMRRLVEERLYIESLYKNAQQHLSSIKVENGFLRDQNVNLNHDVQALLNIIHHARSTGHWEMNCVTFCELTPEQVFGPVQSISNIYSAESESNFFERRHRKLSGHSDMSSHEATSTYPSTPSHYPINLPKKNEDPEFDTSFCFPRCASLPEIGNIYHFQTFHKSISYEACNNGRLLNGKPPEINKNYPSKNQDTPELLKNISCINDIEVKLGIQRGQSEPHLFMFDDTVYKYRPCEYVEKTSSSVFNENYQPSLPPYQSIDLKFPTEESSLKLCAWNKLKTASQSETGGNSFIGDTTSNSSCTCSDSEIRGLNKQMLRLYKESLAPCVHNEKRVPQFSIGVQTEADKITQGIQVIAEDINDQKSDISENSLVLMLKDNLIKSKYKVEEKEILIDQLQNHLTIAVKEVELKDEALKNVEKKLQNSRDECSILKNEVGDLNSQIQLISKDLEDNCATNANLKLQMEQQGQIIRSLQEALVQSKRAFDAAHPKTPSFQSTSSENLQPKNGQSSRSSIVDI